jgi:hypothetical protein
MPTVDPCELVRDMHRCSRPVIERSSSGSFRPRAGVSIALHSFGGEQYRPDDPLRDGRRLGYAVCNRHHVTQVPQSVRVDIPKTRSLKLKPNS